MLHVELAAAGDVQVNRRLLRTGRHAAHPQPAFQHLADYFISEETDQFASEGGHASGGWAPLAASTQERKEGPGILDESGELRRSYTDRGDPNMLLDITDDYLLYGSQDPKAKFHQRGTSRMPQRRALELAERARQHSVRILQLWITRGELLPW